MRLSQLQIQQIALLHTASAFPELLHRSISSCSRQRETGTRMAGTRISLVLGRLVRDSLRTCISGRRLFGSCSNPRTFRT